jgi:hypothetical protein
MASPLATSNNLADLSGPETPCFPQHSGVLYGNACAALAAAAKKGLFTPRALGAFKKPVASSAFALFRLVCL